MINKDLTKFVGDYTLENYNKIKFFLIVFAVNIFIYNQKITNRILCSDDYLYLLSGNSDFTSSGGRWFFTIVNHLFLKNEFFILPQFWGIITIFSFTLAGVMIANYLLPKENLTSRIICSLLFSTTPAIIHQFFFNVGAFQLFSYLFGAIAALLLLKNNFLPKLVSFIITVCVLGIYQPIFQVTLMIVFFDFCFKITDCKTVKDIYKLIIKTLPNVIILLASFIISNLIAIVLIKFFSPHADARYAQTIASAPMYLDQGHIYFIKKLLNYMWALISIFHYTSKLHYIKSPYVVTLIMFTALGAFSFYNQIKLKRRSLKLLLIIGFLLCAGIILNLPKLLRHEMELRGYIASGVFLAGIYAFTLKEKLIFKNAGIILATCLILISTLYANVFYDAHARQTQLDIIMANQIVNRIRLHPDYIGEETPLTLKVIGTKDNAKHIWFSAFNRRWSAGNIFKNFTDLNCTEMSHDEFKKIKKGLKRRGKPLQTYPQKGGIIIDGKFVILVLDSTEINKNLFKQAKK